MEQRGVAVHQAHFLAFGAREGEELLEEAGGSQSDLAGVGTDVEGAALGSGGEIGLAFENGDGYAVVLQDASADETTGACSDDGDAGGAGHGGVLSRTKIRLLPERGRRPSGRPRGYRQCAAPFVDSSSETGEASWGQRADHVYRMVRQRVIDFFRAVERGVRLNLDVREAGTGS
ncbi:hypothetical protein GCM10009678_25110 [Actinomadura kijaniata]